MHPSPVPAPQLSSWLKVVGHQFRLPFSSFGFCSFLSWAYLPCLVLRQSGLRFHHRFLLHLSGAGWWLWMWHMVGQQSLLECQNQALLVEQARQRASFQCHWCYSCLLSLGWLCVWEFLQSAVTAHWCFITDGCAKVFPTWRCYSYVGGTEDLHSLFIGIFLD